MARSRSENEEQYDAAVAGEEEEVRGAILSDAIRVLNPSLPILVKRDMTVRDAARRMIEGGQGACVVVDEGGRLVGIFSERDVLKRVVGQDKDVNQTKVGDVMTPSPEALTPDHKIAFALNRMSVGGFRNMPIVDAAGKPIAIVFTRHFVNYLVALFPGATLNLPPNEELKHPNQMSGG